LSEGSNYAFDISCDAYIEGSSRGTDMFLINYIGTPYSNIILNCLKTLHLTSTSYDLRSNPNCCLSSKVGRMEELPRAEILRPRTNPK
jgi:hypothetical protein